MKTKIILLDSNSLIHRAYHALPFFKTTKGQSTGAIFGFLKILLKIIQTERPTHIAAVFDVKGPTFRHELYPLYKSTRKPMDEELATQFEPIKELLSLMKIKTIELSGYEGDDLIGTLSKRFKEPTIIVTGDRDSFQLADSSTCIHWTKRGVSEIEVVNLEYLKCEGFSPESYIDYKALRGDPSDNIPGVAGVGEKTAKSLIAKYGSLDSVLAHADEITGKVGENIRSGQEIALLSRKLSEIAIDAPIECKLTDIVFDGSFSHELPQFLKELEMTSLLKGFEKEDATKDNSDFQHQSITLSSIDEVKKALLREGKIAVMIDKELSFAFDENTEYTIDAKKDLFSEGADIDEALKLILFAEREYVLYDAKAVMRDTGFSGKFFDLALAYHLVNGSVTPKGLSFVLEREGYPPCACAMLALEKYYKEKISKLELDNLIYNVEFPLVAVLANMETRGVSVDVSVLNSLAKSYDARLYDISEKIFSLADMRFNIASPKQLGDVLFNQLDLKRGKKTKTGYSVDEVVLTKLKGEHPIISEILKWRHLSKLQGTYVSGMKSLVRGGKIHTEFTQTITATGRLSSVNPNLQNLPARSEEAEEIKSAFTGSDGGVLVSADYSQIELRLLAHFSEDVKLIEAYNSSVDIHASTAAAVFKVPLSEVTGSMRRDAKAVNFGIIYGISDFGLSQNLGISISKARDFINAYFETYPGVKKYMDESVAVAKKTGYSITLLGRKRKLDDINSTNALKRSGQERMAMNTPLQGSASDIVKVAMLGVERRLKNFKSKMILQVHDELIVDAREDEVDDVIKILTEEMCGAAKLKVPLVANAQVGKNWGLLK